jgi:methyl-accepting chemotaxis protein
MLKHARIATKLQLAFAAIVALLLVLFAAAMVLSGEAAGRARTLAEVRLPNTRTVAKMNDLVGGVGRAMYAVTDAYLPADLRAANFKEISDQLDALEVVAAAYEATPKSEQAKVTWVETGRLMAAWRETARRYVPLARQRDAATGEARAPAQAALLAALVEVRRARKELAPKLEELQKGGQERALGDATSAASALRTLEWTLGLVVVAIVAISIFAFLFLRRELASFVGFFGDKLRAVAAGDLPEPIDEARGPDFNDLRDPLNQVSSTLRQLIAEMNRMSGEHEQGEIDAVVEVARFQGAYAVMARGVNDMVGAHIAVKKRAVGIFADFGRGNFDATLELLPGKKRFINEAIEQVRGNLKGLIAEMGRMSAEHEKGDIDVVIDTGKFQGQFQAMARGVNEMVGAHIAVKKQAMAVVAEFGRGNFQAPMPQLPGKKRFINEVIEQVRTNLKALAADAELLSRAAVEGRLEVRADAARQPGDFRKIVQGINDTLDAVIAPMRDLAAVLDKLAAGDLAARADPSRYQNESRRVLEGVNTTLGALLAPVNEATTILGKLAERDLRARMTGDYQGDHAKMKAALNATAEALHGALAQVADAVEQVTEAAQQIAASSQAVATGASEQASALQETGASIESVSSSTKQAVDSAQQANSLAQEARGVATEGAAAVEQMQGAMGRIKVSAESTSQIIKDINEIAFQTNLLALNAAVEAARAGEAGRGFAVVAEEVRSLALRAKEAAMKTEELIRQSVREANGGEATAKQVATRLAEIVTGVGKVTAIISEIAAASKEQAAGIEQVNTAIAEMDKVTQQNAASAEESSSAASELNGQSEELSAMVGAFRLERSQGRRAAPAVRARGPARLSGGSPAPRQGGNGPAKPAPDAFPMDDATELRDF